MRKSHIFGACLFAALLCGACSRSNPEADGESGEPAAAVPDVTVTKVVRADISRMLDLPATVTAVPNRDVKISPLVGGAVTELNVAEGDRVSEGQLIARLDEGPLRDELRRSEAAAEQTRATLENATIALARNEDLLNRGIAARKEVEDARTARQVAEGALRQAEAEISLVQLQLQRVQVRSPLSGIVVKRFINVGEQVDGTPGQPLIEVANLEEVELSAGLPLEELSRMHVGEMLVFTSGVFPGKVFSGRIVAISAAVDAASNTAQLRVRTANAGGVLRLGMNLTAQIAIETHKRSLVVPPQALYRDSEGTTHVYRVEGNESTSVPVKLGLETPAQVEVLSGVSEGDTVILDGGYGLEDEAKVSVKSDASTEIK